MIEQLNIKDYAIIEELDLELYPGLTVITGETGSGKTILLEALAVSLGSRADRVMVRHGAERAGTDHCNYNDVECADFI